MRLQPGEIREFLRHLLKSKGHELAYWKINCMEDKYPGLWQTWFREQIVAVGWPRDTYSLRNEEHERAWVSARRNLLLIEQGDKIVVQLKHWRVGRIGTVLSKAIEDNEWEPSVPPQSGNIGEMGRRIHVKWDLTTGPLTPDYVVELPEKAQPNPGIWRPTLSALPPAAFKQIERAVSEKENWGRLIPGFASERALSEYISASPHLLEDGMVLYPSEAARELVFPDSTRLDVLLLDREGNIVIVECKQHAPTLQNLAQLRGYMSNAEKLNTGMKVGKKIRGILVHGGAQKLRPEVRKESKKAQHIELLQFSVTVGFAPSL